MEGVVSLMFELGDNRLISSSGPEGWVASFRLRVDERKEGTDQ